MTFQPILQELKFRNLTVKNRIFRSSISGRFDNYNGSGNQARINWETKFARGGVGAIITSFVPVTIRDASCRIRHHRQRRQDSVLEGGRAGRALNTTASCSCSSVIPGRQQDIGGVENQYRKALSSTNKTESFHGLLCQAMTRRGNQADSQGLHRRRTTGARGGPRRD